jgi:hypothetical protein
MMKLLIISNRVTDTITHVTLNTRSDVALSTRYQIAVTVAYVALPLPMYMGMCNEVAPC